VGYVHEKSANQSLSYSDVELPLIIQRNQLDLETFHGSLELETHVFRLSKCSRRYIVRPRPIFIVFICSKIFVTVTSGDMNEQKHTEHIVVVNVEER